MECENCPAEDFVGNCADCGANLCAACEKKNKVGEKAYCDLCNEKYFEDL